MHIVLLLIGAILFSTLTYIYWGTTLGCFYGTVDVIDILMLIGLTGALDSVGDIIDGIID